MAHFEALLKLEKHIKRNIKDSTDTLNNIEAFPIPDYEEKKVYTEITISKLSPEQIKILKKYIHTVGYKWQSGNFIKNEKDLYLTMLSPMGKEYL